MARFMPQLPDRYFANVNPDLLAAIPFNAGKVLEIGAGAGALGAAFKRRHPACLWVGVEVVSEAAEHASSLLDEVYVADIELVLAKDKHERPDWLSSTATYDAIVFGDVLEHLKDPWAVLRALSDYLADDGVVLACIPNVGHWTIIESLLRGQFQYTDAGLLDRTHLRFFTAATMLESFRAAALVPTKIRARDFVVDAAGFERFAGAMQAWIAASGEQEELVKRRLLSLQYVIRAKKSPSSGAAVVNPRRMVIAMLAMAPAFADIRTRIPLAAYASLPDVEVHFFERSAQLPELAVEQPKVLIVQRQLPDSHEQWAQTVQRLAAKGWLVLAEWDDHPDLFASKVREVFDRAPWASVKACHGVMTSTQTLAQVLTEVRGDDRVLCFENQLIEMPLHPGGALDDDQEQAVEPGKVGKSKLPKEQKLTVFYGALNRTTVAVELMQAVAPVFRRFAQLELLVLQDRSVFDAAIFENKRFVPQLNYEKYHELLAGCHIALLPLAPSFANACKSDLKFIECAAHGLVCIASPTVYAQSIRDGVDGLIAHDLAAMAQSLEQLVSNPALRHRLSQNARARVRAERLWSYCLEDRLKDLEAAWHQWRHPTPHRSTEGLA